MAKSVPISAIGRFTFDAAATGLENEYLANGRRSIVGLRVRIKNGLRPWVCGGRMASLTTADVRACAYMGAARRGDWVQIISAGVGRQRQSPSLT